MSKNIHRFGRLFFIEGEWSPAAEVGLLHIFDGPPVFQVNYSTRGATDPDSAELRAKAVLAAAEYAKLCPHIFEILGKTTPLEIREHWDQEYREVGAKVVQQWYETYKAEYRKPIPTPNPSGGKPIRKIR